MKTTLIAMTTLIATTQTNDIKQNLTILKYKMLIEQETIENRMISPF
jgi:hypothetical protein